MTTFSERLRARAQELGWSQRALARAAGVSHTHVSKLFDSNRGVAPSYPLVIRLADALGVPDRWLFWGESLGSDVSNPEHNKNLALSIARAGAINEAVLSTVSKEKFADPQQAPILWWLHRILSVNAYLGFPPPAPAPGRRKEAIDKVSSREQTTPMVTKGFVEFAKRLKPRGAKAEAARLLEVPPATVSTILKRRSCGLELATKIEAVFQIPVELWRESVAQEEVAR